MRKLVDQLDATPSKRMFLSIIADYDLNKSVCELVDNALDVWVRGGRSGSVSVTIELDSRQQRINVTDDAGGIPEPELAYIVGPGQTGTSADDQTIGIFGVGSKRAVVALAQDIRIRTRHKRGRTHEVDFDDQWLAHEDWSLPVYVVDPIAEGTTSVELSKLRMPVTEEATSHLEDHLSATYAKFLTDEKVVITVNGRPISPRLFENWAYPPGYEPRHYVGTVADEDGRTVDVQVLAGLSKESSPAAGEYGVYFYCNDRLVARALRTFDVGFTKGLAGLPHPKVSLTRVLVSIRGEARSMPWNSSKSDIDTKHAVFVAIRNWLHSVVKDYASLSRNWMGEWPERVFAFPAGEMQVVKIDDFPTAVRSYLPPLPKSRPRYGDRVRTQNRAIAKTKPWTTGLYEGVVAADLIMKQRLEQRNRIALIVLDSTLEIAFKEFLVNDSGQAYSEKRALELFGNRTTLHQEVKRYTNISDATWQKIQHYYLIRCKLVHERATVGISDNQIEDFRSVVQQVLKRLYQLKF